MRGGGGGAAGASVACASATGAASTGGWIDCPLWTTSPVNTMPWATELGRMRDALVGVEGHARAGGAELTDEVALRVRRDECVGQPLQDEHGNVALRHAGVVGVQELLERRELLVELVAIDGGVERGLVDPG